MRIPRRRLIPLLVTMSILLAGCGFRQAERDVEAARAQLATVKQRVDNMQQDTVAKDKAAWEQHEQQVAAMPTQFQADLEAKAMQAASTGAAATDQALAGLRAEVAAVPGDFQKAVQQAIKQAAGTHAKAMDGLRSDLVAARKDLDGKLQYVRDTRAASADAQVKRLQAMLGAVGKVVAARLDELDKQIAKLPK